MKRRGSAELDAILTAMALGMTRMEGDHAPLRVKEEPRRPKGRGTLRTGAKEKARRLRQIEAGQRVLHNEAVAQKESE